MEIRYSQFAWSVGYALVSMVILVSTGLCLIKVLTLTITRMFEIYLMTAFAGFPLVMLTTRETRPSGIGYFKKFAGVCLQAAILITIIAFAGICFSAAGSLLATKPMTRSGPSSRCSRPWPDASASRRCAGNPSI